LPRHGHRASIIQKINGLAENLIVLMNRDNRNHAVHTLPMMDAGN